MEEYLDPSVLDPLSSGNLLTSTLLMSEDEEEEEDEDMIIVMSDGVLLGCQLAALRHTSAITPHAQYCGPPILTIWDPLTPPPLAIPNTSNHLHKKSHYYGFSMPFLPFARPINTLAKTFLA